MARICLLRGYSLIETASPSFYREIVWGYQVPYIW
jgi:hypothetical protein